MKNKNAKEKAIKEEESMLKEAKTNGKEDSVKERHGKKEEGKEDTPKGAGRKNNIKLIIAAIIIIIIAGSLLYFAAKPQQDAQNPYQTRFANETLNFRADLSKAAAVPVYPDEKTVRDAILSEDVSRVKISYVPGDYNQFYAADSFEIAYKLVIIFKYYYGTSGYLYGGGNGENCLFFEETDRRVCILSEPVPSEEDIRLGNAERTIFLAAANETSVSLKDNIVYIKGKDFSEKGRKYTDLDLATDKFLMTLMVE